MNQTVIYVGLDVDDTQCHGSALDKYSGEVVDFKCRPTLNGLLSQLEKLARHFPGRPLTLCYEASYIVSIANYYLRSCGQLIKATTM